MNENQKPHINVDYFEDLTGRISRGESSGLDAVGERVRRLRREKGLSLEDLADLTGFKVDLLKSIEENEIQPQLGTAIRLSRALDGAFGRLVSGSGDRDYSITRKGQQKVVHRSTAQRGKREVYTFRSLAPEVKGRHMEALSVTLKENPDPEISVHEGEEFIHVLSGTVLLKIGDETFELYPGDSAYYLSTTRHLVAAKEGEAEIIAVMYSGD